MFDYRGQFVSLNNTTRGQLFINSAISHAYNAADVIDNDSYVNLLENVVITLSLLVA